MSLIYKLQQGDDLNTAWLQGKGKPTKIIDPRPKTKQEAELLLNRKAQALRDKEVADKALYKKFKAEGKSHNEAMDAVAYTNNPQAFKTPDTLKEYTPQSGFTKALEVAANPFTALREKTRHGYVPDYLNKNNDNEIYSPTSIADILYQSTVGAPVAIASSILNIAPAIKKGDYVSAGLNALDALPVLSRLGLKKSSKLISKVDNKQKLLNLPDKDKVNLVGKIDVAAVKDLTPKRFNDYKGTSLNELEAVKKAQDAVKNLEVPSTVKGAFRVNNKYYDLNFASKEEKELLSKMWAGSQEAAAIGVTKTKETLKAVNRGATLRRSDFVTNVEEQQANELMNKYSPDVDFSVKGKPKLVDDGGKRFREMMDAAKELGLPPDELLKRNLIKLSDVGKPKLSYGEHGYTGRPFYFNPQNPSSGTRSVINSNKDYQMFAKDLNEKGTIGGKTIQTNPSIQHKVDQYNEFIKDLPNTDPIKISFLEKLSNMRKDNTPLKEFEESWSISSKESLNNTDQELLDHYIKRRSEELSKNPNTNVNTFDKRIKELSATIYNRPIHLNKYKGSEALKNVILNKKGGKLLYRK